MSMEGHSEALLEPREQPVCGSHEDSERALAVKSAGVWSQSKQNVKRALKEYGGVAVLLYACLSLSSLGFCYTIVNMGINVERFLTYMNLSFPGSGTASTFVLALVIHKPFLPVRAAITVTAAPIIVRWLRARGLMKTPVKNHVN